MLKQAIASWGCGKGRIIKVEIIECRRFTSDGVGHLLSLPHNTLSNLRVLYLIGGKFDSKFCELLAHCLPFLPHLEVLTLSCYQIVCDGAHLLSQSLHTNTTVRELDVSSNNIGDRGGCSLAKALSINKGLVKLDLRYNPLGEKSIQQLIHSLQLNHTLQKMMLPPEWEKFSQNCVGYDQAKSRIDFNDEYD